MTTDNKRICRALTALSVVPQWTAWLAEGLTEDEAKAKQQALRNRLKAERRRKRR